MHNLNLMLEKLNSKQTNQIQKTFYKILTSTLKKCQGQERQGKSEDLSQIEGDYEEIITKCNVGILAWFLEQKRRH